VKELKREGNTDERQYKRLAEGREVKLAGREEVHKYGMQIVTEKKGKWRGK